MTYSDIKVVIFQAVKAITVEEQMSFLLCLTLLRLKITLWPHYFSLMRPVNLVGFSLLPISIQMY